MSEELRNFVQKLDAFLNTYPNYRRTLPNETPAYIVAGDGRSIPASVAKNRRCAIFPQSAIQEAMRFRAATWDYVHVATCGVFDLLHAGHLNYLNRMREIGLEETKKRGAAGYVVWVFLNTDDSVRELRGKHKPFVPWNLRAAMLAETRLPTAVVAMSARRPMGVIRQFRPHIWVKGAPWVAQELPEYHVCQRFEAEIRIIDSPYDIHSSDIAGLIYARLKIAEAEVFAGREAPPELRAALRLEPEEALQQINERVFLSS